MQATAAIQPPYMQKRITRLKAENPFVAVPPFIKVLIGIYWAVYGVFYNVYCLLEFDGLNFENFAFTLIVIARLTLTFYPIIWMKRTGMLHPLVLPPLIVLAKDRLQEPLSFLTDFVGKHSIYSTSSVVFSRSDTINANIRLEIYGLIALIIFYIAFFNYNKKPKKLLLDKTLVRSRLYVVVAAGLIFFIGFFASQGGIQAYINSWGLSGGRTAAISESGLSVYVGFLKGLFFIPLVWYLATPGNSVLRNPIYLGTSILFISASYLGSGGRSDIFSTIVLLICIYIFKNKTVPLKAIAILAFLAFFLFGALGSLRNSATYNKSEADFSVLDFEHLQQNLDGAAAEGNMRNNERPSVAAFAKVPDKVDFLYGQSFASILTAYIPRQIWADKPHTGAYYTGKLLFDVPWGVPISGVAEIYWNFSFIGVVFIYFLWGRFQAMLTTYFVHYRAFPGVVTLYFILLLNTASISSLVLSMLLQTLILVVIGLRYMKLI